MTHKFLCPLCKKKTAYISDYGLGDCVICRCQGLKEVGRFVNNEYVPTEFKETTKSSIYDDSFPRFIEKEKHKTF